jgi:hypothetical protein
MPLSTSATTTCYLSLNKEEGEAGGGEGRRRLTSAGKEKMTL